MAKKTPACPTCPVCGKKDRVVDLNAGRTAHRFDEDANMWVNTGEPLPPDWWCESGKCVVAGGAIEYTSSLRWAGGPLSGQLVHQNA